MTERADDARRHGVLQAERILIARPSSASSVGIAQRDVGQGLWLDPISATSDGASAPTTSAARSPAMRRVTLFLPFLDGVRVRDDVAGPWRR
ncbi:MAG: hypothetical protein R3E65_10150 [Steroidobacteraceae bacterium]